MRAAFRLLFVGFFWHFAVHISKHLCHPHREYFTIAFVWKAIKFAKIPLHLVSLRDSFKWRDYNSLLLFILHNRFDTFKWVFSLLLEFFRIPASKWFWLWTYEANLNCWSYHERCWQTFMEVFSTYCYTYLILDYRVKTWQKVHAFVEMVHSTTPQSWWTNGTTWISTYVNNDNKLQFQLQLNWLNNMNETKMYDSKLNE